jgi:hypothetical protein
MDAQAAVWFVIAAIAAFGGVRLLPGRHHETEISPAANAPRAKMIMQSAKRVVPPRDCTAVSFLAM